MPTHPRTRLRGPWLLALAAIALFLLARLTVAAEPPAMPPARPIVIAHRGASGYLPEHTLPAKALAHGQGADAIEQDVVMTKDGVPVVLHDTTLDAVSDIAVKFPG